MAETDPFVSLLLARAVGPGYMRMQQQVHPGIDAPKWHALEQAMQKLPEATRDTLPNMQVVNDPVSYRPGIQRQAYVDFGNDPRTINIVQGAQTYHNASKGDRSALDLLAGQLVHEAHHVSNGLDERSAYDAELNTLQQLGASKGLINQVLRDKLVALTRNIR